MIYPECPNGRADCRFQEHGGVSTCMYSPIERDRGGLPIGVSAFGWATQREGYERA